MTASFAQAPTETVDIAGTPFAYREVGVAGTPLAYREEGPTADVPLVLLNHITAVLDDWDPAVVDGLAADRRVIAVDLRGVGASGGTTPDTIEAMAADTASFLEALGVETADLLGFSLGGMVAQTVAQQRPDLIRRLVLVGTSPAADEGPATWAAGLQSAFGKADTEGKHPKHFLFFTPTPRSQSAADAFLTRLTERTENHDHPVTQETITAQLTAATKWERATSPAALSDVQNPTLIVNGDNDTLVPTISSFHLAQLLPNATLSIYPDAGHGALFQHHNLFVDQVLEFLRS
ncbi:alpha/beta hydrolase [Kribbella ginsengisoli]|uniref:Alpha/beta hydrolase n=1 Tax=Kribbella ginsengisoli TaxID=363865 RepID=A0ABP6X793_9ACTN